MTSFGGFDLLGEPKEQREDGTLDSRKLYWAFIDR